MGFPTTLPGLKTDFDSADPIASADQNSQAVEINALGAKVGVDGSAVTTSHAYKLSALTGTEKAASDSDLTTHEADTSTHGVTTVAGLTETQTLTNKTLTSPKVTAYDGIYIGTTKALEIGTWGTAANYVLVETSEAGSGAVVASAGSDTNVDLALTAKGTGVVKADGVEVVTLTGTQTLTNKTLTSPKLNEDVAVTTSATELNLIDGLTSTATELNALDGQTGAWTVWTPTTANLTKGGGVITAKYVQIGKTVSFRFSFKLAADSAMGTSPSFTLPTALTASQQQVFDIFIWESGVAYFRGFGIAEGSTTVVVMYANGSDGTYVNQKSITATVPMTWGTNDEIQVTGTYEAA